LQTFGNRFGYLYFLADRIAERESGIRKEDGKRDAGKTAPCTQVEDRAAGRETGGLGDGQGMEDVMHPEILHSSEVHSAAKVLADRRRHAASHVEIHPVSAATTLDPLHDAEIGSGRQI